MWVPAAAKPPYRTTAIRVRSSVIILIDLIFPYSDSIYIVFQNLWAALQFAHPLTERHP